MRKKVQCGGDTQLVAQLRQEINACLEQLASRNDSMDTSTRLMSSGINGRVPSDTDPVSLVLSKKEVSWTRLLSKQFRIIEIQDKLLEKSRKAMQDLEVTNAKLHQEIEELKKRRDRNASTSRGSSPTGSSQYQFLSILRKSPRPSVRHTYILRRQLPQAKEQQLYRIHGNMDSQTDELRVDNTNAPTPGDFRKTRATALPRDLVPSRDFTFRRSRQTKVKFQGDPRHSQTVIDEAENEDLEIKVEDETEIGTQHAERIPRIQMHLDDNFVSTLDPQFLPPALFQSETVDRDETGDVETGNIEVPSWRIRRIDPCRISSGGEDLEDSTFSRRHYKAEEDERRRKRWDAQKRREEEYVEQLKVRLARGKKSRKRFHKGGTRKLSDDNLDDLACTELLQPNLQDVLYLQVEDQVPINVFGRPLPAFQSSEFTLPWHSQKAPNLYPLQSRPRPPAQLLF